MRVTGGAACKACGTVKGYSQLLRVTSRITGRSHFVCRPGIEGNDPNCFRRGTCSATHHSIALATDRSDDRAPKPLHIGLPQHLRDYVELASAA